MRSLAFASLATAASAATQIPFFIPGMGPGGPGIDPVASIVKADPTTTVMALACPTGTEDTECPWGEFDITVSVIAKTEYALSVPLAQVTFDCTSKNDMTCTAAIAQQLTDAGMDGYTAGNDGMVTGTTVYPSNEIVFQTASVTAGQEKLGAGAVSGAASSTMKESAAKETDAASSTLKTTGSAAASTGASPSSTGPSPTGTAAPTGTGNTASEQATGAASRFGIEGAALLVLAGAAAAHVL